MITEVNNALTQNDKAFILSVEEGNPNWTIYDFKDFPAVQWKLQNIDRLEKANPEKHKKMIAALKGVLQL